MARRLNGAVIEQLGRIFGAGTVAGLDEAQLLERFVHKGDEVAFEALVTRYGPMVLGVCRRTLADPLDVEDAFQATFLVLVRKAGSIRNGNLLGNWLYGVAHRVAVRARANAARLRVRELAGVGAEESARSAPDNLDAQDLRQAIDLEVSRLPEKLRKAVVLCYLEGRTHDEAADRLGCPVGTVRSRLARARDLLRTRLTRQGLAPSATLLTGSPLTSELARASVPLPWKVKTVQAAITFAATRSAGAGMVSATSAALASEIFRSMIMTKFGIVITALAFSGVIAGGIGIATQGGFEEFKAPAAELPASSPIDEEDPEGQEQEGEGIGTDGDAGSPPEEEMPFSILSGQLIVGRTPEKDAVWVYSISDKTKSVFRAPKGVKVTPIVEGEDHIPLLAVGQEGEGIKEVAVYITFAGGGLSGHGPAFEWNRQELSEPFDGSVQPILSRSLALFPVGHRVYAFSSQINEGFEGEGEPEHIAGGNRPRFKPGWAVLELEEGAEPVPKILEGRIGLVQHNGQVHIFEPFAGTWDSFDIDEE